MMLAVSGASDHGVWKYDNRCELNKGFIRPHSYCVRPELCFVKLEGKWRVASSSSGNG
jgi:hypothetical protein